MADTKKTATKTQDMKDASDVKVEDLGKVQVPQGDHVTVGGDADKAGEPQVTVRDAEIAPGVVGQQGPDGEAVQEVVVLTDTVVRDPLGPLGVQIPSAALTDVHLPIHDMLKGTPDQQLERGEETQAEPGMVAGGQQGE